MSKKLYALTERHVDLFNTAINAAGDSGSLSEVEISELDAVLDSGIDADAAVGRMARAHYIASARPIMSGNSQKEAEETAALQWDDMGGSDAPDEMYFHMNSMRAASNALLGND